MRGVEPTVPPGPSLTTEAGPVPEVRQGPRDSPADRRRRRAAVLVAVALPVAMGAPWYSLRVSARGAAGGSFSQQLSGWAALSTAAVICLLVAVGVCALVAVRALLGVSGLGAEARSASRARIDGALIAAGGLLCIVTLLWTSVAPPAIAHSTLSTVSTHTGVRWGVLLALALAAALTALGVQITAAAGRRLRDRQIPGPTAAHQPAPGRSHNQNTRLSAPMARIPSRISQRKRVM